MTQQLPLLLLLTLPWLNPFAFGPTPAVVSLLFAWTCVGVLLWVVRWTPARASCDSMNQTIAGAWLAAALLSSVMGLLQYFGATAVFGGWVNSTALGEAYANLRQRNQFASLTSIGLVALLWRARHTHASTRVVVAAMLLGVGNAVSSSRTGLVQLGLIGVLVGVWGGWRLAHVRRALVVAVCAYAAVSVLLPWLSTMGFGGVGIMARLQEPAQACSSRLVLWSNVLHLIAQKPWLGWGWGELDYAHFITLYPGERFCDILDNAHNLPLHLAVELGVPFAALLCGGCGWLVLRAKPWREADPTRQMAWAVLVVIGLHSLLEYPLWYGPFQIAAGLCIWLIYKPFRAIALMDTAWLAILLIASCTYAAWDYWRVSQIYMQPATRARAYQTDTLEKIRASWLFRNQVRFAELTTTPLTTANAERTFALAQDLLHFSPEAKVAQALIVSAVMLGRSDDALFYQARFDAAFPQRPPTLHDEH